MTILLVFAALLILAGFLCSVFVLKHAFGRSLGTGFIVLCVPWYNLYYSFSQFEHPRKGLILAGYLGLLPLGAFLQAISQLPG
jgi:translocator protein